MTHHHNPPPPPEGHDGADRAQRRATMAALAAELGIGPEDTPPAAVADLVSRFGPASYAAARHVAFDPTCLRWLALIYRFWAEQLLHYADAEDLAALDLVTEAERLLRDR